LLVSAYHEAAVSSYSVAIFLHVLNPNEKTSREGFTSSGVKWESRCVVCTESLADGKTTVWKNEKKKKRKFKRFLLQKAL
jgi:hypothetical protein